MNPILKLRKKHGLTQKDLADKLFVNQTAVSQWERGVTSPNPQTLLVLADLFSTTTDYLLNKTENKNTAPIKDKDGLTEKDYKDIGKSIDRILGELDGGNDALMFHGEPLDDETRALIRTALEIGVKNSKIIAKEKFTPNKYKKENN